MHIRRGISFVELLVVIAIIALLIGLLLPALSGARQQSRQLKDATQVRTIVQSFALFAHNNRGRYPLPSEIDNRAFPGAQGELLNTTGHMLSYLIAAGFFGVEGCISPVESNVEKVRKKTGYQFTPPTSTPDSLWDPTFRGTPIDDARTYGTVTTTSTDPGNNSYAPLVMVGRRRRLWSDTTHDTIPVFGNRGPTYTQTTFPPDGLYTLTDNATGVGSNTLLIHGPRHSWEGNIGHNDGHISFEIHPNPTNLAYASNNTSAPTRPDNLFINESDERAGDPTPTQFIHGLNIILRPISRVTGARPNYSYNIWTD